MWIILTLLLTLTGCAYTMEDAFRQYPSCRNMESPIENCFISSHPSAMPPLPRTSGPGGSHWNAVTTPSGKTYYNMGGYAVYGPDGTYIIH